MDPNSPDDPTQQPSAVTASFTQSIAEAERLVAAAPHVQSEQDLLEGYQYLAGCVLGATHAAWATEKSHPTFVQGTGPYWKQGLDNPDTMYFGARVEAGAEYLVTGVRGSTVDLAFQVIAGAYTDDKVPGSAIAFDDRELEVEPDGSYEVRFGPEAAEGRTNYYTLTPGSTMLVVREVYSDWSEKRGVIRIQRVDAIGTAPAPLERGSVRRRFDRAGRDLVGRIKTWLQFPEWFYLNLPVNSLTEPRFTPGGLTTQYSSVGHYDLDEDQAIVITLPLPSKEDAPYLGFQLGSLWYISLDYVNHQTSLNRDQAQIDPDGKIRLVVSERNPGVTNWVETVGHARGYLQFRWHRVGRPMTEQDGPTMEVVPVDDVAAHLPYHEQNVISPADYAARIAQRQAQFADRMLG